MKGGVCRKPQQRAGPGKDNSKADRSNQKAKQKRYAARSRLAC